jgi:hypothetical protein
MLPCGTVFKLIHGANGKWTEKVLHNFNGPDGAHPMGELIFDKAGNLYGTTSDGGANFGICPLGDVGCGTVFELSPGANGQWTERVLYSFKDGPVGNGPVAGLIFDKAGNLYGTTVFGGESGCPFQGSCGVVFELTPGSDGQWTEKLLYSFKNDGMDGSGSSAGLIFDKAGNLYGTSDGGTGTCFGGGCGTVFELKRRTNGTWSESVLHRFKNNGKDGSSPSGKLIFNKSGNLYGATGYGGNGGTKCDVDGCGTVFELRRGTDGKWSESILYNFKDSPDGHIPSAGLVFDKVGNLYGTTSAGGTIGGCVGPGCGTVFELTP